MQRPSLKLFVKLALSVPPTMVYVVLLYIASHSLNDRAVIDVLRHIVLAAGLAPLCAWVVVIFLARRANVAKLLAAAIGITILHWVVLAISSHYDGLLFWSVQAVEIAALVLLVRFASRRTKEIKR